MSERGWIGVDLDCTLAYYDKYRGPTHIGKPIPIMVKRVQRWLAEGRDVRIFTARVAESSPEKVKVIEDWCAEHIGRVLPITCVKDRHCVQIFDDKAIQVRKNSGRLVLDTKDAH